MNPLSDNPFKVGEGHRYTQSAGLYDRLRQNPVLGELKARGVFCVNGTPNVEGGEKYALWHIAGCSNQKNLECQMGMRNDLGLLIDRSEMPYGRYWELCRGGPRGHPNITAFDRTVENYGKCVDADGQLKDAVYWGLDKVARTASKTPTAIMRGLKKLAKARAAKRKALEDSSAAAAAAVAVPANNTRSGAAGKRTAAAAASAKAAAAVAVEDAQEAQEAAGKIEEDDGSSALSVTLPTRTRGSQKVTPGSQEHAEELAEHVLRQACDVHGSRGEGLAHFLFCFLMAFLKQVGAAMRGHLWRRGAGSARLWEQKEDTEVADLRSPEEAEKIAMKEHLAYSDRLFEDMQRRKQRNGGEGIEAYIDKNGDPDMPSLEERIARAEEAAPEEHRRRLHIVTSTDLLKAKERAEKWKVAKRAGENPRAFQVVQQKGKPMYDTIEAVDKAIASAMAKFELHVVRSLDFDVARRIHDSRGRHGIPRHIVDTLVERGICLRTQGLSRAGLEACSVADETVDPQEVDRVEKAASKRYAERWEELAAEDAMKNSSTGACVDNYVPQARATAGHSLRANEKGEKSLNLKAYNHTKAATSGMSDGVVFSKTVGILFPGGKLIQDVRKDRPPAAADFKYDKLQTFLKTNLESLKIGLCGERPTVMQDRLEKINAEIRSKDDASVVLVEEGDLEKAIKYSTDMYDAGGLSLRKHTRVIPNARAKSSRRVDYVSWVLVRTYGGLLRRLRPNLDIDFLSCTDTEFKNHLAVCLRAAAVGTLDNDDAIDTLTHLAETPQIMHTCQGLLRCALADESTTAMLWGPIIGDLYKFSKKKFGAFNQRVEREGAEEAKGGGGGGGSDDDSSSDDEGGSLATRLLFNSVDDYEFIEDDPAAEIAEAIVGAAVSDQAEADATARADEAGRLHELQAAAGRRRSERITARRKVAD